MTPGRVHLHRLPQAGAEGRAVRPPGRAAAGLRRAGRPGGQGARPRARRSPSRRGPTRRRDADRRGGRARSRWSGSGSRSAGGATAGRCGCRRCPSTAWRTRAGPTSPGSPSWTPAASSTRRRVERVASREGVREPSMARPRQSDPITLWRPSSRPGASRPTSTPSSPSAASWSSAARRTRCPTASGTRTRRRSRPRPRSGATAPRGVAGLQGRPTSSTSARASSGTTTREPDKWDLPNAEERAAENELPPLDSPQAAGRGPRPDRRRAPLAGLPPRRGDEHPLPPLHHPEARRHGAGDLGPDAEAQGGPALDPAQHRREAAGPRGGPRLPARPLDAHATPPRTRARRSW